nr:reverse transcriptase domain-containing protein [Tanacetum cinerariifolium]
MGGNICFHVGHQYNFFKSWYILSEPGWTEYFEFCDSCIIKALKSSKHGNQLLFSKHNVSFAWGSTFLIIPPKQGSKRRAMTAPKREAWPPHYETNQGVGSRRGLRRGMKRHHKARYGVRHSPAEEAEAESNVWDDELVDFHPFGGGKPSLGLKIEIHEFTGKVHTDDFIDWLSTVERVFDVRDIPDKLKVKLVAIKLRQHAFFMVGSSPKATTPTTLAAGNTRERVDNTPCCYKYNGLGNCARDCLNLKTLTFLSDDACPIYDTDAEPKLDEPCDEFVYPDRGEVLVLY